jgi:SAM-dependent methyltransferase
VDPESFKAFEAERWGAKAESYERVTGQVTRRLVEPLLDAARVGPGTRVLDVATGPGHLAGAAAERGATATGIDIADGMLAAAAGRHPRVSFLCADAERLPFAAGEFDAVVGAFVLNHLPCPEEAAAGFARVLAPGGQAAFTVWERPPRSRLITLLGDAARAAGVVPAGEVPAGPDSFRFADEGELRGLLSDAGLSGATVETIDLVHEGDDLDELWRGMLGGSVRGAALVEAQGAETRERIRIEFARLMDDLRSEGRYRIPVAVKLGSARKP